MKRIQFDLKLLLVIVLNICVLTWTTAAMATNKSLIAIPLMAAISSMSFIWFALLKKKQPIAFGTLGGFAGVVMLTVCFFVNHGVGYFFYAGPSAYFEDGAFAELVIFPILWIVYWGGFGAVIGFMGGMLVWCFKKSLAAKTQRG
jgi:hypothetical protein